MRGRVAALLALTGIAGLLGWLVFGFEDPVEPAEEASYSAPEEPEEEPPQLPAFEELEPEPEPERTVVPEAVGVLPEGSAGTATTAVAAPSPDTAVVRGILRDRGTKEVLPLYTLRVQDETGRREEVLTDEEGRFATGAPMAGGKLFVTPFDDPGLKRSQPSIEVERLVLDGASRDLELDVPCGPTYRLAISPANAVVPTTLRASLQVFSLDDSRRLGPETVRAGDPPWVRFEPVPGGFGRAERLEVRDVGGIWAASPKVSSLVGVVPGYVDVMLEARAVLTGRIVDPDGTPLAKVGIAFEAGGKVQRRAATNGEGVFRIDHLRADVGTVQARLLRYVGRDEVVRLVPGSTTQQDFVLAPIPAAGAIRGRLESETGAYDSPVDVVLRPLAGGAAPETRSARWEDRGDRRVGLFDFEGLPAGAYEVTVRDGGWFAWEPRTRTLSPPFEGAKFVVRDDVAHAELAFRPRDAETGAALDAVFTWWQVDKGPSGSRRLPSGQAFLSRFPVDRRFQWRLDRAGYRPKCGDEKAFAVEEMREGRLHRIAEVEMTPGWGEVYRVVRRGNRKPIAGAKILLDGKAAGTTKSDGLCVVGASERPQKVEVEYRDWRAVSRVDLRPAWRRKEKRFVEIEIAPPPKD